MSLTVPTRESLHSEGVSDYAVSQPTKSVSRGSTPYLLMRAVSGLVFSAVARLLFFDKQRLPDTAEDAYLSRWGNVYQFPQLGATGAARALGLRCAGTIGAAVTVGSQLTHADGTIYQVTTVGALIGGGGTVDVDVAAISTGAATNKIAGEVLTFSSPPLNVNATATVVLDLKNGTDRETQEAYRQRLLAHIGDPPEGGALHDYIEWALSVPGNATAYVWRNRRGLGTIDVAVLGPGHGASRVVVDLTATQDYLDDFTRRPGNVRDVRVLATTTLATDAKMVIGIDTTKFKWDWTDDGTGYNVTAANSGTSTITVPTAPATVVAGVRITVNGEEATVTQRVTNDLTLAFTPDIDGNAVAWFTASPVGSPLRASGDLVTPVRFAMLGVYDRLGPARVAAYAKTQWESSLQTDSLLTAARNVLGCTKATLVAPGGDIAPVDALAGTLTVPFLVPGVVQVVQS